LKENAAYHEAKLNQTRLESRIADLEKALLMAKVAEQSDGTGDVALLGSVVKLFDKEFQEEMTITLVGSLEADPSEDLISISSPLGEAVLGRSPGDEIQVEAPGGIQNYHVLEVN
jgi:transcription elongation factor GreA